MAVIVVTIIIGYLLIKKSIANSIYVHKIKVCIYIENKKDKKAPQVVPTQEAPQDVPTQEAPQDVPTQEAPQGVLQAT